MANGLGSLTLPQPNFIGTPGVPGTGPSQFVGGTSSTGVTSFFGDLFKPGIEQNGPADLNKTVQSAINPTSSGWLGTLTEYFLRATIIILGFIFMAVGLSMFKSPAVVSVVNSGKAAGRGAKHVAKAAAKAVI